MLEEIRKALSLFGFEWSENPNGGGKNRDVVGVSLTGRTSSALRLLGQIRPKRLLSKFDPDRIGALFTDQAVAIESIEFLGEREVVALGTTSKTFIASGFATHNSAPEGYFDDCVCALALARMCFAVVPPAIKVSSNLLQQARQLPARRRH